MLTKQDSNNIIAYVGLGSNLGDSKYILESAIQELMALPNILSVKSSSLYTSQPQEMAESTPLFYNQVALLDCSYHLDAKDLLNNLFLIENKFGRTRTSSNGYESRTLDLDLLMFGNMIITERNLTVPHKKMKDRAFVLLPLLELNSNAMFPDGTKISLCLDKLDYSCVDNFISQNFKYSD